MNIFQKLKDKFTKQKVLIDNSIEPAEPQQNVAVWARPQNVTREVWQQIINSVQYHSKFTGIPEQLLLAVIWKESRFNHLAVSGSGACGLMQLIPTTALGEYGVKREELFDIDENISCGSKYLAKQLDKFQDLELALAAYNAGPGTVRDALRIHPLARGVDFFYKDIKDRLPKETQNYVSGILEKLNYPADFI